MRADLSPNRISISDRYPMLGFTIRAHGGPQYAEVTVATDPALFDDPSKRSPDNFFSTASIGPLPIEQDEAVYILPPEVLARFVGKERLYFALATKPAGNGGSYQVQVRPDADSIYISLAGLTGRSLRRVRVFPSRGTRGTPPGFGQNGEAVLHWAGDTDRTGTEATTPPNGNGGAAAGNKTAANGAVPATPAPYNDGFGDLPPLPDDDTEEPEAANGTQDSAEAADQDATGEENTETEAIAAALGVNAGTDQPVVRDIEVEEQRPAQAPSTGSMGSALRLALRAMEFSNPALALFMTGVRAANAAGLSVAIGPSVSGGFAAGAGLGYGIIFAPDDELGVYGSAELDLGAIFSLSATVQLTVLNGGVGAFAGISYVAGFSAGEGIVGGGNVIFDSQHQFLGVTVQIGIGVGSPLDVYAGVQRGIAEQLGFAAAFGHSPIIAEPMLRDSAADARRYVPVWRDLLTWSVPSSISSSVRSRGMSVQTFRSANGDLNIDRYEVRIDRLPRGKTAESLIRHVRVNIADFVDERNTEFNPYAPADGTKWRGSSPAGSVFNLDIAGPDNAAVVASMVTARKWRFTTLTAPDTGSHPVSGHREFGIRNYGDSKHILYTRGADRFTYANTGGILDTGAFFGSDDLWESFQEKVVAYVNRNGGSATVLTPFQRQFSWPVATSALSHSPTRSGGGAAAPAHALGVGSDPYTVEIKYRMFIPSPVISGPISDDYGGDGRGFSYASGSSRGEITANVKLTPGMGIDRVRIANRSWGESTAYDSDDTFHVSGKPDWWLDKRSGARVTERDTLRVSDDNLNVFTGTSGRRAIQAALENASVVTVHAAGAMPLQTLAPDIDADIAVFFRMHNGAIQIKAVGQHDGFPAHELYVNRKSIYRYDPVAAGNGPTSLVGYGDIDVDTSWVTVARPGASAQALGFNESFTINWDDVQQVAQPTNLSCWAAAAAMIVGWRDRISLSPRTIAEIANRPIAQGLSPNDFNHLAQALGLKAEPGQSYSKQAFRDLLEENGPLWVGVALPSLHAIVVTGLYSEGDDLYVRITDPWDRAVGAPGSPGGYASTHATGSRYIMKWEDFVAEFNDFAAAHASIKLQVLHADGTHGHTLNTGGDVPPGYAAGLGDLPPATAPSDTNGEAPHSPPASPPASLPRITMADITAPIAPATVTQISGPNGVPVDQRWTDSATRVLGANHASALSGLPALAAERGWTVAVGPDSAEGYGAAGVGVGPGGTVFRYGAATPAAQAVAGSGRLLFTIAEGTQDLFTQWAAARSFSTDGDATGAVLLDAENMPLALAVRLLPGPDLRTRIEAIAEAIATGFQSAAPAPAARQPAPATEPPMEPPRQSQPQDPAVYGQPGNGNGNGGAVAAALGGGTATPMPVMPPMPAPVPDGSVSSAPMPIPNGNGVPGQPQPDDDFPPPGVTIHRSDVERNGVQYHLFLMDGRVMPEMPPAVEQSPIPGQQIVVDDWPYHDGASGRSKGGIVIDWSYGAGAVANVRTAPAGPAARDGWSVDVHTDIAPGRSDADETRLTVTIRTRFTKAGEETRTGVTEVTLSGSGKHDVVHRDATATPELIPA